MTAPRWLLLAHHLPSRPTRLRVRVWRQLQKLGAVAVKNSVYVLPWSEKTHEDFTWLRQEVEAGGGEAVLFRADAVAEATNGEIIAAFRRERDTAYGRLAADLDGLAERIARGCRGALPPATEFDAFEKEVDGMQAEFDRTKETDFFEAPGGARAAAALARCRSRLRAAQGRSAEPGARVGSRPAPQDVAKYQGRLWVTRPRPHIDRCASAWLIRRFIDRRPRFAFVEEGAPHRGIPFDMAGAEFGHHGEDCTFETLLRQFGLGRDVALQAIAEIVHDVDLKDGKFGRPEAIGVNAVLRGLGQVIRDDQRLLRASEAVFDGLHATLAPSPPGKKAKKAKEGNKSAPRRRS